MAKQMTRQVVAINLLKGRLDVVGRDERGDEGSIPVGRGPVTVGLIVGLCTQPRLDVVSRTTLQTLAFEGPPPINWKQSLEQAASRLRRLGLPITTGGDWQLKLPPDSVDLLRFERLAKEAIEAEAAKSDDHAVLTADQARKVWDSDPGTWADDFPLLKGAFDRFRRQRRTLIVARARALRRLERGEAALDDLETGLLEFPADHAIQELHSQLLVEVGELGQQLGEQKHAVLHNLPHPDEQDLVGRVAAYHQVTQVLRPYPHSQHAAITVDGVGGVGKSALVKKVAYGLVEGTASDEQFYAIVWVSAKTTVLGDGVHAKTPTLRNLEDVYSAIAMTLQRPDVLAAPVTEHDRLIRELLADPKRRVLLIIDNLETVDDQRVFAFLRDLPAPTKAVITTRHRVDGAFPLRLEGLEEEHAAALASAAAVSRGVTLNEDERKNLASFSGGIPLAIIWTVGQVSRTNDLNDALRRLRSASGDYAEFSFRDSVRYLVESGNRQATALLYAAALFAEDASREALGYTSGVTDSFARDTALQQLTDLSLINHREGRYHLLPLTREFIRGEFGRDLALAEPAIDRWLDWHEKISSRAVSGGADLDPSVLRDLRIEHHNILWAIDFAMRSDVHDFTTLVRSMEFFWLGEGLWNEFEHYLDRARVLAPKPEDKVHFTGRLMWLYLLRDDLDRAEEMRRSCELALKRFDVPYERMRLADFTGQAAFAAGDLPRAEKELLRGFELATELNDRRGIFATQKYLGEVFCALGKPAVAREWFARAKTYVGDPKDAQWLRGMAHLSQLEGLIAETEENWESAESAYRECLRILLFHPDGRLKTRAQEGLARSLHAQHDTQEALAELHEVQLGFERLGMWSRAEAAEETGNRWRSESASA